MLHRFVAVVVVPCLLALCTLCTLGGTAHAALPPMSEEELTKLADLIVDATVRKVEPVGEPREDHCYTWQEHRATLAIDKTKKGDETITSVTVTYGTIVKDEKDCVGGSTSYSLDVGAQYALFLKRREGTDYRFISYSGVNQIAAQGSPAPSAAPSAAASTMPEPTPAAPVPSASLGPDVVPETPPKNGGCACEVGSTRSTTWPALGLLLVSALCFSRRRRAPAT